ncbi:Chromate resistance protein ChrB, partial [Salinispora arenicola]|uniref:Chromate resistance protein ChrB n=1 Tax=Salinispora arenicola TaxID=168697 RepID=UPI0027DB0A63
VVAGVTFALRVKRYSKLVDCGDPASIRAVHDTVSQSGESYAESAPSQSPENLGRACRCGVPSPDSTSVAELVHRADGHILMLDAVARNEPTRASLKNEFNAARIEEWAEFISECDKYEGEIAREKRIGKLTVAELDEEEQSLDRLRRWFHELKARDIFGVTDGIRAEERLKQCVQLLDSYADYVYQAVHAPLNREEPHA